MDKIAKIYDVKNKTYKIDVKNVVIIEVEYFEIIKSLQKFWLYEKQYKNRNNKLISQINQHGKLMRAWGF